MEFFIVATMVWGLYKFYSSNSSRQQRSKSRTSLAKQKSDIKVSSKKEVKSNSQSAKSKNLSQYGAKESPTKASSHSNSRRRTYSGTEFTQPGEKGKLFGFADKRGRHGLDGPFSIIDLETSGFHPPASKILEIAILKIDGNGREIDRFQSLINPEDDNVGRTDIHGISLSMLQDAPTFDIVSGRVLELIQDSVVVAHNARFEETFLAFEFNESGYDIDLIPALDTLWLARNTIELPNYKLETVIEGFNERIINAHTALGDVIAVSKILPEMLNRIGQLYYPIPHPQLPSISVPFKPKIR